MDRSFLSNAKIVKASRDFVCMRLATYEDADEAKFLTKIYTRRGALENTVFAILAPDGVTQLVQPGRGPKFRNPAMMAEQMSQIVDTSTTTQRRNAGPIKRLPEMKSLDFGDQRGILRQPAANVTIWRYHR